MSLYKSLKRGLFLGGAFLKPQTPFLPLELLAWVTISFWMLIPLFWLPLHLFPGLKKRLRKGYYLLIMSLWGLLSALAFKLKVQLWLGRLDFPLFLRLIGTVGILAGLALQLLTLIYLKSQIIGLPHLEGTQGRLVVQGPFAWCRHPTYLAHTLLFWGAFLFTGYGSVGLVALLDFLVVQALIIPLEEKELRSRFGSSYQVYQKKVPKFWPRVFK